MVKIIIKLLLLMGIFSLHNICSSQNNKMNRQLVNRPPSVAGQFYPSGKNELRETLRDCFSKAKANQGLNTFAVISPHAGYVYSGVVAASAFNQIDENKQYKHIFIFGSSHSAYFKGASIYSSGNYVTPLGEVEVDTTLAIELKKKYDIFNSAESYHFNDHVIEVQLPFLQYKLKTKFKIIPVMIGGESIDTCRKIAEALKQYLNSDNLFIISSDFSHYPCNNDAVKVDKITADAILSNSADSLIKTLESNSSLKINKLETSLCSWTSVLSLLYMTENDTNISTKLIEYQNSGNASYDKTRVVGYNSIAFSFKNPVRSEEINNASDFNLNDNDKKMLLKVARTTIENYIKKGDIPSLDTSEFPQNIKHHCGAFVTLHENGQLRGCIGQFITDRPLYKTIQDMAVSSSSKDYRFSPVKPDELNKIEIEISVLSPLKLIKSADEIELGKHGIYIKKGYSSGTFLPQVATETGWTISQFLGHCAQDKAGIGWDGWKDAEIYIYTADIFSEQDFK
jgi:MEMO1 family protein